MTWKTLTETSKPQPGLVYQCDAGHEWYVANKDWETLNFDSDGNRVPNNCPTCELEESTNVGDGSSIGPAPEA